MIRSPTWSIGSPTSVSYVDGIANVRFGPAQLIRGLITADEAATMKGYIETSHNGKLDVANTPRVSVPNSRPATAQSNDVGLQK